MFLNRKGAELWQFQPFNKVRLRKRQTIVEPGVTGKPENCCLNAWSFNIVVFLPTLTTMVCFLIVFETFLEKRLYSDSEGEAVPRDWAYSSRISSRFAGGLEWAGGRMPFL